MSAFGKYVNPFTDFGFKRLFGEEPHKGLLQDFLYDFPYSRPSEKRQVGLSIIYGLLRGYFIF
jgi:PD-(D/E)XK nuclease family transposase